MTLVYLGEVLGHVFIMYSALQQEDKDIHTLFVLNLCLFVIFKIKHEKSSVYLRCVNVFIFLLKNLYFMFFFD